MMLQTPTPNFLMCLNCEHEHFPNQRDNTYPCSNIRCKCRHFISINDEPEKHKKYIRSMENLSEKIEHVLKNIPSFRNLTNKQFVFAFWHYNNNFTTGMTLDARTYLALPDPESIRRCRQRLCEKNAEYKGDNEKFNDEKLHKEWGILQWVTDRRETDEYA